MRKTRILLLAGVVLPAFAIAAPSFAAPGGVAPVGATAPFTLAQAGGDDDRQQRREERQQQRQERQQQREERSQQREERSQQREERQPKAERPERQEQPERQERPERAERPDRQERPAANDRSGDDARQERRKARDEERSGPAAGPNAETGGANRNDERRERREQREQRERPNASGRPSGSNASPDAGSSDRPNRDRNEARPDAGGRPSATGADVNRNDGDRRGEGRDRSDRDDRRDRLQDLRDDRRDRRENAREERQDNARERREDARDDRRDATQQERVDRLKDRIRDERRDARSEQDRLNDRIDRLKDQRKETRDGTRVTITEPGGRRIIRDGDRVIIRRDETARFRLGINPRDIREERRGGEIRTVVTRPDGSRVVTITDDDGRLIRRVREYRGQEYVLIDNRPRGGRDGLFVDLDIAPPRVSIPRERYIVDADVASSDDIEEAFTAPPVQRLERSYSLDEIRQSRPLREYVRSVDLDSITFDTGSWDVRDDQITKLEKVGLAMEDAVKKNPRTVFMIEGHTDAVGSDEDNLSLSDRRAESVAEVLTKYFDIPAENLTTQGYGEQYLKVQTDGPEEKNRRVTVRNITPLLTSEK